MHKTNNLLKDSYSSCFTCYIQTLFFHISFICAGRNKFFADRILHFAWRPYAFQLRSKKNFIPTERIQFNKKNPSLLGPLTRECPKSDGLLFAVVPRFFPKSSSKMKNFSVITLTENFLAHLCSVLSFGFAQDFF